MAGIWTMGEILVEVMRPKRGMRLDQAGEFLGPYPSGAPAIFIDTAARLGHEAGIIGGVGADDFGKCVLERLQADGVDCRYVRQFSDRSTAVAFVTYFEDGSRKFLYHIDGTPAAMAEFEGTEDLGRPDFFHLMGCSLMVNDGFRAEILKAMNASLKKGAAVSFDPNIRVELLHGRSLEEVVGPVLDVCSVLLPGTAELALLSGEIDSEAGARRLFERYPLDLIVEKRGREGCTVYARDGRMLDIPAYVVDEVDPTGAGDCFDAGFLCALLDGHSLEDCARVAAAAGALNTAAFGPMEGIISPERIKQVMHGQGGSR
jgi:tagatose kinase